MYGFLMVIALGFQEPDSMTSCAYSSDDEIQCNSGPCNEKRRRVHNEVERRRKDKINNWIIRISDLLPDKNRKKQCINEILEQAVIYIRYLQDANDKLLQDKCTEVQVEELRRMTKKMKELEEENNQCLRLLQKAGITSIACPEEFCDHKSGRYSNKITPEQASALLTQLENDSHANGVTKLKSVMQNKSGLIENNTLNCNGKKFTELTENASGKQATCAVIEKAVPSEKTGSSTSTPQSLPSNNAENQITTVAQHCPSPSVSTNISKCQYAASCSSGETNLSSDVCDITAVTQALPPVPVMSTSQNSSVHQNSLHKTTKQSVTPINQLMQPQILSPCAPAPPTNRSSAVQNIASPLLVINEHGIPVLHNIVAFQNIQPSVFSNCSSAPAILTSSSNEFGQAQSPITISQIAQYGNYKPIYVTKDANNSTKIASASTTFGVTGSPNSSIAGVPILASNSGFTSTVRPQSTLAGEAKSILSPLIAQVPVPGSSQGCALKLSTGLPSSLGQGTLSQIISHPVDDLTASSMHLQPCNNHNISQSLPSNTLPPTMVTPGGILVGHPLSIGQPGQVLTMGNGQILTAQSSVSAQQNFPTALILPNGQVIPVVSQPSVVYANPTVNNNIVLAQTGKQNLQAASPSVVTNIKNQSSPLLANSINNTILFSPSGSAGNNFKLSSVALTLSQASSSQSSASFTGDMTSNVTQKSNNVESLRSSQSDHVIAPTEEEVLKCSGTTQAFQGSLPAVACSKSNGSSSETTCKRPNTTNVKGAGMNKSNKSSAAGNKRVSRVIKPKPSSTSSRNSAALSGKMQQSARDISMNSRKQAPCSSTISSSDSSGEKMAISANINSTNSLSSNSPPASKTDDQANLDSSETPLVSSSSNASGRMTTDILAKAAESIFASCVSDLSPSITSFTSSKTEGLHNSNESLLDSEKSKDDNEQKHDKQQQQRYCQMDSSSSSVADSCVSTQPQDLLSTLTATVFGDSSVDSSGDELAFSHVDSSPKLMPSLSRNLMSKGLKNNSHVEPEVAKLKCRTNSSNTEVPPLKKVKTVEPSPNGTATSAEQCREKAQSNCFAGDGLTSSNSEDSQNRITSTTKCFLGDEKQFKQKIVCTTTDQLSPEVTQMPTSVSQLLLADSTSALCAKSSQSSERQSSNKVNFVGSGENTVPDTELPALILGSLGDDSNTPSSVNGSSSSGIPFLALSPSEHFPSDLPKDSSHSDGSFNILDNCRSSSIESVGSVKNKRTPFIHQKNDINKANSNSDFGEINSKSSDQSKQVLSTSRLPDQETDISSTLSPPLVMKSNCSQAVSSQQSIVHEDNLSAIQKETHCPPTPDMMRNTSQTQSEVNCQASILSPVTSLNFIAPSPPPLLSRNMINENHTSMSSPFPPLSTQSTLGITSTQTQLPVTASQTSNSTHIPSFKQPNERSVTPKKSVSFPNTNPPSIITSSSITSTPNTSTNFVSHTTVTHTLSNYSAEALIGQQSITSTALIHPAVSQSYYSGTSNNDCPRTSRPPISYSAESLIQTQSCIDKKQDMMVSKDAMSNNISPNMNSYRNQTQHFQQRGGQQSVMPQGTNVSQSLPTNVTDRRLSCSNLIPSSDMMPPNSLQSNFHLQGTPSYANLSHTISTGPQQNLMNNHFGSGPPILMRHGAPACQQLDQCLPCNQPSHNSSSLSQGYSLTLGGNKNCHTVNTFHQNRPPVDASVSQTLPSCLSNSGNLSNIPITNSQQQNGCLFPNHTPSGSLLQVPDTNFSILQNSSSFNNQVRNESRPPVFNNFSQHAQNPLVNNLFHGPFVTNVNTQRNEANNAMPSQQQNRQSEGVKHVSREQRSSSQSQSPPNQTKISPKSKSNAKKTKQNTGTEDVVMSSTSYENINTRMSSHFSVPDLSFPRNETPCLGNTYFGGTQRPLVPTISNIQTQTKSVPTVASTDPNITANPTYNPLFRRQSENSLNFNFQPSSFSVNSLHRPTTTGSENISSSQITCHTTAASGHPLPNFNLSNIFPDISTSNESINLPGMKFHHNNHIISPSASNQIQTSESSMAHPNSHQNRAPPPLYHGRTHPPVIHNSVGFNGILGPNAHGFEGHGTQVAMGINNSMGHPPPPPPPFAPSHSHTPSFGNVLPPLNFPMHDH